MPHGLDLYAVLGVNQRAEPEVIEAAYRVLARKYHPDLHKGDDTQIKQLNEARRILSKPDKRAQYDFERRETVGNIIGNYRILEEIAEGGFGTTYKAEHVIAGELVCVKHCSRVSSQSEAILIEEARAVWDLRHYALPTMRDMIRLDDGSIALVMSYIPGMTLTQIVEQVGAMDAEDVAWIAERVLNGLAYLHFHGVIHGDIKPQNIIIQPDKHMAVLVDFGLSLEKPTATSKSKGYTDYFAPHEEIAGLPLIPESDLYSLGMTMIYALTADIDRVKAKQIPTKVPDELASFIAKLIRHDVLNRPNWHKEDLCGQIKEIRRSAFGRANSGMKPIRGL